MSEPELSVVVCCYNGADQLGSTLDALAGQTARERIEVLVVDDGSVPPIPEGLVTDRGAVLVRHPVNRGLGAARNTGIASSRAPLVAFTDDDCRPQRQWAESLLEAYQDPTRAAVGGSIQSDTQDRILGRYYRENQPVRPLEAELNKSGGLAWRLWLYVRSNLVAPKTGGDRPLFSLVGANMSFRRSILEAVGGFDEDIRFGGDDEDICDRIRSLPGPPLLWCADRAVVDHDFDLRLSDTLRRARSYGRGNGRQFVKHRPAVPTVFPGPVLWLVLLALTVAFRRHRVLAVALPLVLAPRWVVLAGRRRSLEPLAYAFLQMAQETASDLGFLSGFRSARKTGKTNGGRS